MFTAGSVLVPVVADARGLQKQIGREATGAGGMFGKNFSASAERSTSKAGSRIGQGLKRGLLGVGAGAALVASFTVKKGIDRALGIEEARAKLRALGNDVKTVDNVMKSALKSVRGTAFGLDEAATVAAGAVAAGIKPGQQLTKYLSRTADAATIAGTSLGEMGSIFNKVQTNGVAYTDDLQQLADRGIPIFQYLRKEYGVTADELRLMVTKGMVDSKTYAKVIRQNLAGAALESGNTTRGALKNLGASLGRIGEGLVGGLFSNVKGGAQGLTASLAPLEGRARSVGQALGSFVQTLGRGLSVLVQYRAALIPVAAGLVAYKVATLGVAAAQSIQAISATAAATQTTFLNAAFRASPIGLVITALTALGVGLVVAYKRSETFRNIVNGAWSAIKTGLAAAWSYISPVLASFRNWLGQVLPPVIRVLGAVFKVYFFAISTYIKVWWAVASKVFSLFVGFLKTTVFPVVRLLYTNVVKPYFGAVGTVISNVWSGVIKPTFGLIRAGVGTLGTVIGSVVGGIRSVWSGLKQAFAGPVDWVLKNVITPLISAINAVSNALTGQSLIKFKMPTVGADKSSMVGGGKASGRARNGGFAGGGWTGPGSKMTPAGVVHADEFVTTKWARRRLERQNPGGLDAMNRTGRWPGYVGGGRVRPLAGGTPSTYAGHTGVDFNAPNDFGKPIQAAAAGVVSAVKHLRTSFGNHVWLRHAGGVQTIYAHMSKTLARVGQQVAAGQTIGRVGSTGNSSGPHLHFEVRPGGTYGSAMAFLRGAVTKGATGAGMLGDPVSELRAKIAKIKAGIGGMTGWAKGIASGSIGKLGKQAIAWALGKADDGASLLSPAYGTAKWLKGKLSGDSPKQAARNALKGYGWGDDQWSPLNKLWKRESNWNPRADNPRSSAYGIPQALPGSKMASAGPDWKTNPLTQVKWGLRYIKDRYGSPAAAWAHSQRTGWYANGGRVHAGVYDRGGVVRPGTTMVQNKSRKPEALLSNGQWKAIQALAGIVRRKSGTLGAVNAQLSGQPLPYTLTRKAREQKQQIDKLERQYDRAKTDAERKKIRKQVRDARDDLAETRKQRERVQRLIEKRRVLEVREARRAPSALTGAQSSALLGRFNAMTLGGGSSVTSGFLASQLGVTPRTAEQLRAAFTSARGGALGAANATTRARRRLGVAQANAKPVQQRLAAVDATLAQAKSSDVLRESFRKESETVKKLAKQRADADSEKQRKKIQKQIDAARARQAAIAKEYKTNRNLRNERKKLAADSRLTALTAAQKRLTTATTAQAAADARATAAAEAYKAAQEAAVEKATGIRDAGIGLGSLSSATSKTSGGVIANLRRSVSTVGTWGAIAQGLIAKGLRGPIMAEFLEAGPSVEGVRLGRSLLNGNQISLINGLQSQLKYESEKAAAGAGAYLANPRSLASGRAGSWSTAGVYRNSAGKVDMSFNPASSGNSYTVKYEGMPADTVESIANKTAAKVVRMISP